MQLTTNDKIQNAVKWIDGLIDGDFKKGIGKLGNEKMGYCCLGAGCKILNIPYRPTFEVSKVFQKNVGLTGVDGEFKEHPDSEFFYHEISGRSSLVDLNDNTNKSLADIGKFIKKNANHLFIKDVATGIIEHYKTIGRENKTT